MSAFVKCQVLKIIFMSKDFNLEIPDSYYEKMSEIQDLLNQADDINKKLNNFGLNLSVDTINEEALSNIFSFIF